MFEDKVIGSIVSKEKLETLVESIFKDNVKVYESYSVPDNDIREFREANEIMQYIEEVKGRGEDLVYLSIYYIETCGYVYTRKINLTPEKCNGATLRYSKEGWGIIQFQLWIESDGFRCDIGTNSEKRSNAWSVNYPENKSPDLWDWKEVAKHERRLKRVLRECA